MELCSLPISLTLVLALTTWFYARGWVRLRKIYPQLVSSRQIAAFAGGLVTVWIAVGSPLAALDHELLSVHMIQHILLMAVAPALMLLGAPVLFLSRGLPNRFVQAVLALLLRRAPVRRMGRILASPIFCWLAATITTLGWHIPAVFELGRRSHVLHEIQYVSFVIAGLLFWWPVIQPWPSVSRTPRWSVPAYLFLATLPCDALSAFLAFCERVVYRSYTIEPRISSLSPLQDQEWAGVLMWVSITFIYMAPAVVVAVRILSPSQSQPVQTGIGTEVTTIQPLEGSSFVDS